MIMKDTDDPRIKQTDWFPAPQRPLLQYKIFYAKLDTILFYVVAKRGATEDTLLLEDGMNKVDSIILRNPNEFVDNSKEMFTKLQNKINSK